MSGTFPGVCNAQQLDTNSRVMSGCLLTVYEGGTTQLAMTYQDIGLTIPTTNPLIGDASGRLPLFFVTDGTYSLRLTNSNGIQGNGGFYYPQIPSIGASTSGGGGSAVDPSTIASTGDLKWRLENAIIAGWVRLNGRTIGNASSGASERANNDTQALYIYCWTTYPDSICPVIGGRGASALADFNAGKQLTLLDARDRLLAGLDDMGNAAAGRMGSVPFQRGNSTTGGSYAGEISHTLVASEIPSISSSGINSIVVTSQNGLTGIPITTSSSNITRTGVPTGAASSFAPASTSGSWTGVDNLANPNQSISVTSTNTGSGAHNTMPLVLLGTLFIKL